MYGTVARFQVKPGAEADLRKLMEEFRALNVPGFKGDLMYRTDSNPNDYFMAVAFENKAAYQANAGSPAQHQRYLKMRELLTADPEWHDGEIVFGVI